MSPDGCYDEKVWGREAESEVEPGAGVRLPLEYEVKFPLSESVRGSLTHYVLVHEALFRHLRRPEQKLETTLALKSRA